MTTSSAAAEPAAAQSTDATLSAKMADLFILTSLSLSTGSGRAALASVPAPEPIRREVGTLPHRLELLPHHGRMDLGLVERLRGEAAIGARHHILAPNKLRKAHEALGDELRMLDDIARMGDDAGTQHLALGHLDLLEEVIFVLVARIGAFETVLPGLDL